MQDGTVAERRASAVLTVPNLISVLRLGLVPLFAWLALNERDLAAFGVLAAASASDWLDGRLARVLNQYSRLGELLDPAADRLFIFVTLVVLAVRDMVPVWLVVVIVALSRASERVLFGPVERLVARRWGTVAA